MVDFFLGLLGEGSIIEETLISSLWGEFLVYAIVAGIAFVACTMYIYLVDALAGLLKGLFKIK